jgi:acetoacetyl-CoA synthetase
MNSRLREGDVLWTPGPEQIAEANLTAFTGWLHRERGLRFSGYDELWRWSVADLEGHLHMNLRAGDRMFF